MYTKRDNTHLGSRNSLTLFADSPYARGDK